MSIASQRSSDQAPISQVDGQRLIKLSVAMVAYNHERFIEKALESVLAQRVNFEYEIVVGEDCSTDATRSILTDLCRRRPERVLATFQERNVGMARNLRATLAACRGQYIAVIECDDYWTSAEKLQRQVDFLDQHPEYAICCHRVRLQDEIGVGLEGTIMPPQAFKPGSYTMGNLIAENFIPNFSAVMYRADSVGAFPDWLLDLEFCDWPLHILVARSGKIQLMDEIMGVYRIHSKSLYSSRSGVDQKRPLVSMFKRLDQHLNFQYTDAIGRAIALFYFDMAIVERLNGNRRATLRYLTDSVCNGRLRMAGRWRTLMALLAYSIFGFRRR